MNPINNVDEDNYDSSQSASPISSPRYPRGGSGSDEDGSDVYSLVKSCDDFKMIHPLRKERKLTFTKSVFLLFVKCTRLESQSFDVQVRCLVMFIVNFLIICGAGGWLIFIMIISGWKNILTGFSDDTRDVVCCASVMVVLFLNIIQYVFIGRFWVLLFLTNFVLFVSVIYAHSTNIIGLFGASPIITMLIPILLSFYFVNITQFLFWAIFGGLFLFIAQIVDIVQARREQMIAFFSLEENDPKMLVIYTYFFAFFVLVVMLIIFSRILIEKKHREKLVMQISEGILCLDFKKYKYFEKFEKMDPRFTFSLDLLFASMVHNLRIYKSFLPDIIHVNNLSTGEGQSDSTGTSGTQGSQSPLRRSFNGFTLTKRTDVVVMQFNLNCSGICDGNVDTSVCSAFFQGYVNIVSTVVRENRGVVDEVSSTGSQIYVSFNAVNMSKNNFVKSVKVASEIHFRLVEMFPRIHLNICSVQLDSSLVGYIKCRNRTKNLIHLGEFREMLDKMSNRYSEKRIVVLEQTFKECRNNELLLFKQIDYFEEFNSRVYEYIGIKQKENSGYDLMLELENENCSNIMVTMFNQIWEKYLEGNTEEARCMLLEHEKKYGECKDSKYLKQKINEEGNRKKN